MQRRLTIPIILAGCVGIVTAIVLSACAPAATPVMIVSTATEISTLEPIATPTDSMPRPVISEVQLNHETLGRYELLDMTVAAQVAQVNPYDARVISLDAIFTAPDGTQMPIAGFWNGKDAWHIRFSPPQVGEWHYQLLMKDPGGVSQPLEGKFNVSASVLRGAIQVASRVNPAFSSRYLVYQDGTPFYGVGHGDALNIMKGGFDLDSGFPLLYQAKAVNENYMVWWPFYSGSFISNSYDDYLAHKMDIIDLVLRDAQKKDIALIFTIWDHPELRDNTHAWGTGQWAANGFNKLGSLESFFTSEEAWVWQENLYRYVIARWGYSPAIGMWQTVSELNGTNAYDQANPWHEKINAYFQNNDPYHHPTTASMSGDLAWPEGHVVMDAPQVHVYEDFKKGPAPYDPIYAAVVTAKWTETMWDIAEKPNWIGEFGAPGDENYPEFFHNSIWAALAAGAAMTPAEWNGGGSWGVMTKDMESDLGRLAQFVADIPLAKLNPVRLKVVSSNDQVRGWGVAGADGGLVWIQDFSLEGKSIGIIRSDKSVRVGEITLTGLAAGTYIISPYDTWQGIYRADIEVTCTADVPCVFKMPKFHGDLAFKIVRK